MKKIFTLFSVMFLLSLFAMPNTFATSFRGGEELTMAENFLDDTYVAGGKLTMESNVAGDLVLAGGDITITGNIDEDIIIAGGKIVISGDVGDDLRAAGGEITFSGNVADDAFFGAGKVLITEDSVMNGNVVIAGGEVQLDGQVNGNIKVHGGKLIINGSVTGETDIYAQDVIINGALGGNARIAATSIELGEAAVIAGNIEYWQAAGELNFGSVLQGVASFNSNLAPEDMDFFEGNESSLVYSLLTAAFLIFILGFLFPNFFSRAAKNLETSMGVSLLWGLVYFIAMPFIILVLFVSIIGIPVALLFLFVYAFSFYFAKLFTAIIFANMANNHYKLEWNKWIVFAVSVAVFIAMYFLLKVPVIGGIAVMVAVLMAFGAFLQEKKSAIKKVR